MMGLPFTGDGPAEKKRRLLGPLAAAPSPNARPHNPGTEYRISAAEVERADEVAGNRIESIDQPIIHVADQEPVAQRPEVVRRKRDTPRRGKDRRNGRG